jgi:hypothetical protein
LPAYAAAASRAFALAWPHGAQWFLPRYMSHQMADDWEQALRHLTRKAPDAGAARAVLNAMESHDSDRSAALVMTTFVDTSLNGIILYALGINSQDAIMSLLIDSRAPLYTFDEKIRFCTAAGLFGTISKNNLNVMRQVRNAFAHSMVDITFTTPEIERACNRLINEDTDKFFIDNESKNQKIK